mmetsp:Transcript_8755/g.15756  ORF Transcript_8755/g.15756 Transcript_8755/m.15756 type:complete len:218 (+) Transcript_8755:538-1191(+)
MRSPPAVQPAPQLRHHKRAAQSERNSDPVPHLQDLMVGQPEVSHGALHVHGGGGWARPGEQLAGEVEVEGQEAALAVKILLRVQPHQLLTEAVPLAGGARKLKRGVDDVRRHVQPLRHALHKKRVAAGEERDGQNPNVDLVAEPLEQVLPRLVVGSRSKEVVEGVLVPIVGILVERPRPLLGQLARAGRFCAEEHNPNVCGGGRVGPLFQLFPTDSR